MYFGFALASSDIDLWNIDLLDTHLHLLDTYIPSWYFVCLQDILKMFSRYVFKTCSRRLQDISSRHLQDVSWDVSKASDVFNICLGRQKILTLKLCWRCLQDVLETNKCMLCKKVTFMHYGNSTSSWKR